MPEYLFAPYHVLEDRKVPQELIDMCGGPEAFIKMQQEMRNTPLSEMPDVVEAISAEIKRLEAERDVKPNDS